MGFFYCFFNFVGDGGEVGMREEQCERNVAINKNIASLRGKIPP
jgi:hypothetical protein